MRVLAGQPADPPRCMPACPVEQRVGNGGKLGRIDRPGVPECTHDFQSLAHVKSGVLKGEKIVEAVTAEQLVGGVSVQRYGNSRRLDFLVCKHERDRAGDVEILEEPEISIEVGQGPAWIHVNEGCLDAKMIC